MIERSLDEAMTSRRNDGFNAGRREVLENGVRVVSLIRTERIRLQVQQKRQGLRAVAGFTSREAESGERPQTFNQGVDLGTQPAP